MNDNVSEPSSRASTYPRTLAVPLDAAIREEGVEGGSWLLWRVRAADGVDHGFARGEGPEGCLAAFLALERAPIADFAGFARRWGVLGICAAHDLPGVHGGCAPHRGENAHDLFPRTSLTEGWTVPLRIYREPIAEWRGRAGAFSACLRLARALRARAPGETADLARLFGSADAPVAAEQQGRLGTLVNRWLAEVSLTPVFAWPFAAEAPEFALDAWRGEIEGAGAFTWPARSLYPVLLTQFLEAITRP